MINHVKFEVQITLEGLPGNAAVSHFECHPKDKVCGVTALFTYLLIVLSDHAVSCKDHIVSFMDE